MIWLEPIANEGSLLIICFSNDISKCMPAHFIILLLYGRCTICNKNRGLLCAVFRIPYDIVFENDILRIALKYKSISAINRTIILYGIVYKTISVWRIFLILISEINAILAIFKNVIFGEDHIGIFVTGTNPDFLVVVKLIVFD